MANTYYDSALTKEQMQSALAAIHGVISEQNNGRVLAIENGKIVAKTVSDASGMPSLASKTITENGTYDPEDDNVDGYSIVTVNVPNTYGTEDEGKVVSSGSLVSQTSKNVTQNGTYDTTTNSSVTVNVSGGGTVKAPNNDVIFIDYDGTIVYSYSATEFSALTAMPANPSHAGLTAQGWNWSLSEAKTHVSKYGKLVIGQMYITSDGKTRIYISLERGRLEPWLGIAVNGTATVEWGDGRTDTITGSSTSTRIDIQHIYTTLGDYVICIAVSGEAKIIGDTDSKLLWKKATQRYENRCYMNAIKKIEIGNNITFGNYALSACNGLTSITIPVGVTSIALTCFSECYSLTSITIPSTITNIGSNAFTGCYSLTSISVPNGITNIAGNVFSTCYNITNIAIPDDVANIGNDVFKGCYRLVSFVIPNSITTIGSSAFYSCRGLAEIHFKAVTPPTVANANAWSYIPTDCIIYVPNGSLSDYTSAANYPDPATYTYIEE